MQYRINPKNGDKLSILGFGGMRLGRDVAAATEQVHAAIDMGINYFDTAYIYPGNEALLGKVFKDVDRASINIATKLPPYLVRKAADMDRIFSAHLERLETDYIDYYLIHMLRDEREWARLMDLGIGGWIEGKKRSGQIRNIGFSFHGGLLPFKQLIDIYPWEFTMLQLNYYDVGGQAGMEGARYAAEKNMPVFAMEPLRGGRLVDKLPAEAAKVFAGAEEQLPPAEWGLRFVWDYPEITMALSGMNSMEMVKANALAADRARRLSEEERAMYGTVRETLHRKVLVPCTGCNYCMPCPHGVDIPLCFSLYNDKELIPKLIAHVYYILRADGVYASRCVGCGKCETHCPQGIAIRAELKNVAGGMERFPYNTLRFFVNKFMKTKGS